jgi:hypothetical protein
MRVSSHAIVRSFNADVVKRTCPLAYVMIKLDILVDVSIKSLSKKGRPPLWAFTLTAEVQDV